MGYEPEDRLEQPGRHAGHHAHGFPPRLLLFLVILLCLDLFILILLFVLLSTVLLRFGLAVAIDFVCRLLFKLGNQAFRY